MLHCFYYFPTYCTPAFNSFIHWNGQYFRCNCTDTSAFIQILENYPSFEMDESSLTIMNGIFGFANLSSMYGPDGMNQKCSTGKMFWTEYLTAKKGLKVYQIYFPLMNLLLIWLSASFILRKKVVWTRICWHAYGFFSCALFCRKVRYHFCEDWPYPRVLTMKYCRSLLPF